MVQREKKGKKQKTKNQRGKINKKADPEKISVQGQHYRFLDLEIENPI